MKLTNAQINTVNDQLDLNPIDPDTDAQKELEQIFGDHSYFINDNGLFMFGPGEDADTDEREARLFCVASWTNEERNELAAVKPPAQIDVAIDLENGVVIGGK